MMYLIFIVLLYYKINYLLFQVIYAHIIPGQAVFTEPTVHNHGFRDGYPAVSNTKENRVIIRKPNLDHGKVVMLMFCF